MNHRFGSSALLVIASLFAAACGTLAPVYDDDVPGNSPPAAAEPEPESVQRTAAVQPQGEQVEQVNTLESEAPITALEMHPVAPIAWQLAGADSYLSLISIKQTDIAEVHSFTHFDAYVDQQGGAEVVIDMSSIATNVDIRDERLRNYLFEVDTFLRLLSTCNSTC